MSGNEWPPFDGQEEGELANIDMSLPLSDSGNIKETEDEIKYHMSSLNRAYHQLREDGLVVVTDVFNKLCNGPKMEVFQDEKLLGTWGLVKAAVIRPARRGVIRDGENLPAKSLSGPIFSSSMIPLDIISYPMVMNSRKGRRRRGQRMIKVVQPSNPSLFKSMCKKKRKKGKRSKKGKVEKVESDTKEQVHSRKMVCPGKYAQKEGFPDVKTEVNKDFDRDAKVGQNYQIYLVSLS